jgi:hypothetical protein
MQQEECLYIYTIRADDVYALRIDRRTGQLTGYAGPLDYGSILPYDRMKEYTYQTECLEMFKQREE